MTEEIDNKDLIYNIINENDEMSYDELLEKTGIEDKELAKILKELCEEGEIYEPEPQVYKIL